MMRKKPVIITSIVLLAGLILTGTGLYAFHMKDRDPEYPVFDPGTATQKDSGKCFRQVFNSTLKIDDEYTLLFYGDTVEEMTSVIAVVPASMNDQIDNYVYNGTGAVFNGIVTYMSDEEFAEASAYIGMDPIELRDSYDAVFHLVTAAKGAEEHYTKANNAARYETIEEACALDDRLIAAWTGHRHLRIIDNSTDFEEKLKKLINEIILFLGEPDPVELERKYLIEYPDLKELEANPLCRKVEIEQTYLLAPEGEEYRVRRRGENGHYTYFETVKSVENGVKRIQIERRLDKADYLDLMKEADPARHTIKKTRYFLAYEKQYFEIDIYPFWDHQAIVEIELSDENQEVIFPPQLKVIREVTDEAEYRNSYLALNL